MRNYSKWKAILYSTLVFCFAHIFNGIATPFVLFPGAFLLGWIYYIYRKLRLTMLAHYCYNFIVFLSMIILITDFTTIARALIESTFTFWTVTLVILTISSISFYILCKVLKKRGDLSLI